MNHTNEKDGNPNSDGRASPLTARLASINFLADIKQGGVWGSAGEVSLRKVDGSVEFRAQSVGGDWVKIASVITNQPITDRRRFPSTIFPRSARIDLVSDRGKSMQLELCPHNREPPGDEENWNAAVRAHMSETDRLSQNVDRLESADKNNLDVWGFTHASRDEATARSAAAWSMGCADYWQVIDWLRGNGVAIQGGRKRKTRRVRKQERRKQERRTTTRRAKRTTNLRSKPKRRRTAGKRRCHKARTACAGDRTRNAKR